MLQWMEGHMEDAPARDFEEDGINTPLRPKRKAKLDDIPDSPAVLKHRRQLMKTASVKAPSVKRLLYPVDEDSAAVTAPILSPALSMLVQTLAFDVKTSLHMLSNTPSRLLEVRHGTFRWRPESKHSLATCLSKRH